MPLRKTLPDGQNLPFGFLNYLFIDLAGDPEDSLYGVLSFRPFKGGGDDGNVA